MASTSGRDLAPKRSNLTTLEWQMIHHSPLRACGNDGEIKTTRRLKLARYLRGGQTRWAYDVHDRMPAILRPEEYDLWLDPGVTAPSPVIGCLQPFDAKLMKKYPVSTRVNRPENDDPACAQEIPLPNAPQMLF